MQYDFTKVDELIERDVANGFPGAVLQISSQGRTIKHSAYGFKVRFDNESETMGKDTVFDLASNTKIFATTLTLLKLVTDKIIDIDKEVSHYLPDFIHPKITVRMLLSHCSGFGPEVWFFSKKNHLGEEFYSQDRKRTKELLLKVPLEYKPNASTIYSDTGFMLLGSLIEEVTGMGLDKAADELVYKTLGLMDTCFKPIDKQRIAATSIGNTCNGTMDYPNIRRDVIRGEVQDEKAYYCMDGVAGHAGLFSTSSDVIRMCDLIQEVYHGGGGDCLFARETLIDFLKPTGPDETFSCGWRINRGHKVSNLFGTKSSELTIGHSGFVGTLSLIDLQNKLSIVLLTNKVHSFCYDRKHYAGSDFPTGKYAPVMNEIYRCINI